MPTEPVTTIYLVKLRLNGNSGDEVMERVTGWGLDTNNEEGVITFEAVPEEVEIPGNIQSDPPVYRGTPPVPGV